MPPHQVCRCPPQLCRFPYFHLQFLLSLLLHTSNIDQLRLKDQHRVRRNRSHTLTAITPVRLDCERPLFTRAHVEKTLIPALDYLTLADVEGERLAAVVGGVEFAAVGFEGAAVVDVDFVACEGSVREALWVIGNFMRSRTRLGLP